MEITSKQAWKTYAGLQATFRIARGRCFLFVSFGKMNTCMAGVGGLVAHVSFHPNYLADSDLEKRSPSAVWSDTCTLLPRNCDMSTLAEGSWNTVTQRLSNRPTCEQTATAIANYKHSCAEPDQFDSAMSSTILNVLSWVWNAAWP